MRAAVVGAGAVLLGIGVVLSLWAVAPVVANQSLGSDGAASCSVAVCFRTDSLLGPQFLQLDWSTPSPSPSAPGLLPVALAVVDCGSSAPVSDPVTGVLSCPESWDLVLNASNAGSTSFFVPGGTWIVVQGLLGLSHANVTVTVRATYSSAGTVLWLAGLVLLAAGTLLPGGRHGAPAPAPQSVPGTPPPTAEPSPAEIPSARERG